MNVVIKHTGLFSVLLCLLAGTATARATRTISIDFETLPSGVSIAGGSSIMNEFATSGVTFSLANNTDATQPTTIIDWVPTTSPSNFLAPGGPAPYIGGTLRLDFSPLVTEVGSFIIDDDEPVEITAYDNQWNAIANFVSDGDSGTFDMWYFAQPAGIRHVEMVGGYRLWSSLDGWGIDDLTFTQLPEPHTLVLSALGILTLVQSRRFLRA